MVSKLPKKTASKAKTPLTSSEGVVVPAVSDSSTQSRNAVLQTVLRRWYVRMLRFLVGTRYRQYVTAGVLVVLVVSLFVWHRTAAQPSQTQLLSELSQVMIVPQEQPQIATVTDAAALKAQQPFYVDGQNGDVLFLFPQASKAVLFRPSTHQIVNAGPVNVQSTSTKK